MLTFIIALFSILGLLVLHEYGHFIIAKKCGVEVEEFGVGYPPRLFGRKIGETIYSINLIPFGAFVRIKGEVGGIEDYRSFSSKPIWQRALIVLGGVASFWIVSIVLLTIVSGVWGLPTAVSDNETKNLVDPKVQIIGVLEDSPAGEAGLKIADIIKGIKTEGSEFKAISKVTEVQEFVAANKGQQITLDIKRGKDYLEIPIVPRVSPPNGEGPLGVALVRIALRPCAWYRAPIQGINATYILTSNILEGWIMGIKSALGIEKLPAGVKFEMRGPLGIFDLLGEYFEIGFNYFLYLVALISVALALANILPIPALDGGKLVFLAIEAVRKKPVSVKIEQNLTTFFFAILIVLMLYITIKFDIPRLF